MPNGVGVDLLGDLYSLSTTQTQKHDFLSNKIHQKEIIPLLKIYSKILNMSLF